VARIYYPFSSGRHFYLSLSLLLLAGHLTFEVRLHTMCKFVVPSSWSGQKMNKESAQFVKWARVEASSWSGQKFGQFMKWAISRMGRNISIKTYKIFIHTYLCCPFIYFEARLYLSLSCPRVLFVMLLFRSLGRPWFFTRQRRAEEWIFWPPFTMINE
jgi:hypothetical protein